MPLEMWMQEHDDEQYLEGVYSPSAKAIYVNPSSKWKNVKRGYSDYLYTLIHELAHWYFPSFREGFKFEKKVGEIFKTIPKEEVYSELPPWPMKNEMMSILCPKCQCLVTLFFDDDGVWMFRKRRRKCEYCADPENLRPDQV